MNSTLAQPSRLPFVAVAASSAAMVGALAGLDPRLAAGLVGGLALIALAFVAPVTHLVLLLIAAIVPFGVQNRFGFGGGPGSPGLIASDVLLIGGLLRATAVLLDRRPARRARNAVGVVLVFLAVAMAQTLHGLAAGHDPSLVGAELRGPLGFAVLIVALPIAADPSARDRLFKGLVVVGLALGLWGIAQWGLNLPFSVVGDAGVRTEVPFTTAGRGALQGGLYWYPIAAVLAFAALLETEARSTAKRLLLGVVLALNCIDLLVTYERVIWVSTLAAFAFVALKASGSQRAKALALAPAAVALLIASFAIVAPTDLTAARERLASVGQYGQDRSLRFRKLEARHVTDRVRASPVLGSGLGASIVWGRPYEHVPPIEQSFSHNSYLWLAWKLGIAGAAVLVLLLARAVLRRRGPLAAGTPRAVVVGAQAALLACILQAFVYPNLVASVTAAMGLLVTLAMAPWAPQTGARRAW
jgi:hypothetical protein